MKIMLLTSIRKKEPINNSLLTIVNTLEKMNHKVIHEHVTKTSQEDLDHKSQIEDVSFHKNILDDIKNCDIVIAECTTQSLSVGYLISFAIEQNKPTIILYKSSAPKPNLFPTLTESGKIFIAEYKDDTELSEEIKEYIDFAKDQVDVRFNFFISPKINNYLDWIAKKKKIPRSVYLRRLIEDDLAQNEEYT